MTSPRVLPPDIEHGSGHFFDNLDLRLIESLHRLAVGSAGHDQLNGLIGVDEKPDDSLAGRDQLHSDIR